MAAHDAPNAPARLLWPHGQRWVVGTFVVLLAACSSAPKPPPPKEAPPTPAFEAFMADAAKARQESNRAKERDTYRAAAAAYPARKEPWARLADSYFEAADYGNAILAAQEVLQRDATDSVANGMLAVSGLRVSTAALAELRRQKSLGSDTRAQAEEIVQTLRETLGETVLVPKPAEPATPTRTADPAATRPRPANPAPVARPAAPPRPATSAAAPTAAPTAAPATAPTPARPPAPTPAPAPAPAPTPKPATPATNPLDRLR